MILTALSREHMAHVCGSGLSTDQVRLGSGIDNPDPEGKRLFQLAEAKLIPSPAMESGVAVWPYDAAWEAAAAGYLLDAEAWSQSEVHLARFYMGEILESDGNPTTKLDWLASGMPATTEIYLGSLAWSIAVLKARAQWPLPAPADVVVHVVEGGPCRYVLHPGLRDSLREEGKPWVHNLETEPVEGE